jgi:RNA polymerase sigma-70 factor (ECF subfamily)
MDALVRWDLELERFRPLLRLQVRQMQLDPRLRRRFDSSDLVHEAFVKALEHLEQFQGRPGDEIVKTEGEFVRWLQKILENVVRDKRAYVFADKRTPGREVSLEVIAAESSARLDEFLAAPGSLPGEQAEREERLLLVARALDQLPDDERDAILLRYIHKRSLAEIKEQLGRDTPKAVASLLGRALQRLRRLLDTPSGGHHVR